MPKVEAPWAKMPLHVAFDSALTLGDLRVYAALDYLCGKRGWWYGNQQEIAAMISQTDRTVRRAIDRLRDRGHVDVDRLGREHDTVLRYAIIARSVEPPEGLSPSLSDRTSVSAPDRTRMSGADRTRVSGASLPQTETTDTTTARAREVLAEVYRRHFGHGATDAQIDELEGLYASHGAECVDAALREVDGADRPSWGFVRYKLNLCAVEGHLPRSRPAKKGEYAKRPQQRSDGRM